MSDLAKFVQQERRNRVWSADQLAQAAGLSLRTIQRLENGQSVGPETLLALGATLNVDAAQIAALLPARTQRRFFGLTQGQTVVLGLLVSLPTLGFVVVNAGYYAFGWGWLAAFLPYFDNNTWWVNPALLLGAPVLGMVANLTHMIRFRTRQSGDNGVLVDGVQIHLNWAQVLVLILALTLVTILVFYVVFENLLHLIG